MDEVYLNKISFEFSQEGNTNGTTEQEEELILEYESVLGSLHEEDGFYVLKTTSGWSFNNKEELIKMLDIANVK